jgi:hypothetical protein
MSNEEIEKQVEENKKEIEKQVEENKKIEDNSLSKLDREQYLQNIENKIKSTKGKKDGIGGLNGVRNDGELNTAFFIIFSDFLNVFKNEIDKIRKNTLAEKLSLYEEIKTEFMKNSKLDEKMLGKTALLDDEKKKLLEIAENIGEVASKSETNFDIKNLLSGSKKILENAQSFSVKDILLGNIINNSDKKEVDNKDDSDLNIEEEVDRDRNRDRNRERNTQKARLR